MSLVKVEKPVDYFEWLVHQVGKKSWVSLMVLIDFLMIVFANPKVLPLLIANTRGEDMLKAYSLPTNYWIYWAIAVVGILLLIGIIAYITSPKTDSISLTFNEDSAIKGLMPFGFDDAELFGRLDRPHIIDDVVHGICDSGYRFGILTGESGCGKTSFLQAGVCPRLLAQQHRALYVRCNQLQSLESIRHALHEQLAIPDDQLQTLPLAPLLELSASYLQQQEQPTKLVLILDQFEWFFIHQRYQEEQKTFVEALRQWYQQSDHPVKIMVSLPSDFLGQMFELQNTLGMTLEPNRNFMLKKFEAIEAVAVFQTIVEQQNIECESRFVEELISDISESSSDRLVAPVDLQILAWVMASSKDAKLRTKAYSSLQKTYDSDALRIFFLRQLLSLCQTKKRRQAVLIVLLGLTDFDINLSAGILTETELQQRLSNCLAPVKISQALQWLTRADIRLVMPCFKGKKTGFELVHANIIPAIRHLAGPSLIKLIQANQLSEQRGLSSDQARSYSLWNFRQRVSNTLPHKSYRHYRFGLFAIAGLLLFGVLVYKINLVPEVQMWRIKQTLVNFNNPSATTDLKLQTAWALVISGSIQEAIGIIGNIEDDSSKALIIQSLVKGYGALQDSDRNSVLFNKLLMFAERINDVNNKADTLVALAESIPILEDQNQVLVLFEKLQVAATGIDSASDKAKVLQALAGSTARLKDKSKDFVLFEQLQMATDTIDDAKSKVKTFQVLASIADQKNQADKVAELLDKALGASEGMDFVSTKANTYKALIKSATKLKDPDKAAILLDKLLVATQALNDVRVKASILQILAASSLELVGQNRTNELLEKLKAAADNLDHAGYQADTLLSLATSTTAMGDQDNTFVLLEKVAVVVTAIEDAKLKTKTLTMLVASLDTLQEPSKLIAMIDRLKLLTEGLQSARNRANIFNGLARSAAKYNQLNKGVMLLEKAQVAAVEITHVMAKARTLISLVKSASELKALDKFSVLLDQALVVVEDIRNNEAQANILQALALSAFEFNQVEMTVVILDQWRIAATGISDAGTQFTSYQLLAENIAKLDSTDQAVDLLAKLQIAVETMNITGFKAQMLMVIAKSAAQLNQLNSVETLIDKAQATAEDIDHVGTRIKIQQGLIESIAELKEIDKASALLDIVQRAADEMAIGSNKVYTFINLAKTATKIEQPNKSVVLFNSALLAAKAIKEFKIKAKILQTLAKSLSILNASNSIVDLLDKLQLAAEEIDNAEFKVKTFNALAKIAKEYEQLDKVKNLRDKIRTNAEDIANARFKAYTFMGLAKHAARLNESVEVAMLLDLALEAVEDIDKDQYKASTLIELGKIAKASSTSIEMDQWLIRLSLSANMIANSKARDSVWVFLSGQAAILGNWTQARNFADQTGSESGKIIALSRILQSWGELNLRALNKGSY